jgi:hypothetical protein
MMKPLAEVNTLQAVAGIFDATGNVNPARIGGLLACFPMPISGTG